jgi:hypothetical protein
MELPHSILKVTSCFLLIPKSLFAVSLEEIRAFGRSPEVFPLGIEAAIPGFDVVFVHTYI